MPLDTDLREKFKEFAKKSLADKFQDLDYFSKELVFLQGQSNFIEKTLGANEKLKMRMECLVAYSPSVSISRDYGNGFIHILSSRSKFIKVQGPGLIYMDMQVGNRFFRKA